MGGEHQSYVYDELIHEGTRTSVRRGTRLTDGIRVVNKTFKPDIAVADGILRFRREYEMLARIDVPGVVKVLSLEEFEGRLMMVMEDIGGTDLNRLQAGEPMALPQFLILAGELVETIDSLHQTGIIHKDINPCHIIYNPENGRFRLIGFGITDEIPKVHVALQPASALEGTLTYLAPEQTGRMNRAVDYRSDFYSLGATFYQLLTGEPPFSTEDAIGMVHSHIAGIATPPHKVNPAIPVPLSLIVMKLLSKMAEDRYQSSRGLKADLGRCVSGLQYAQSITGFEPGMEDHSEQLQIPQRLYGREQEIARIIKAVDRVCAGSHELLLVAGYAGVGKTTLVHEMYRPVFERNGYFIEGKFDQLQRGTPYTGWIRAFSGLLDYMLMEGESELAQWKKDILAAVGRNGRVLTEIIPKLELVIGDQPPVPTLGSIETLNRFKLVFLDLIQAIANNRRPFVIFLDDLQWIDAASLELLQTLVQGGGVGYVLVIGAYRENEVDALHPLCRVSKTLRVESGIVETLTIENLVEDAVNELVADALQDDYTKTASLTRLILSKTKGNPFFTIQLLRDLVDRRVIVYDTRQWRWAWDEATIAKVELADNVVNLMLGKIANFPEETRRVLSLAACMGFHLDPSGLSVVAKQSEQNVLDHFRRALVEGLLLSLKGEYRFTHDRIRQAAYSLIPEPDRKRTHLEIGRLLRKRLTKV